MSDSEFLTFLTTKRDYKGLHNHFVSLKGWPTSLSANVVNDKFYFRFSLYESIIQYIVFDDSEWNVVEWRGSHTFFKLLFIDKL